MRLSKCFDQANAIRVTSDDGATDFTINVHGRKSVPQTGLCHLPGTISPPPCIETAISPIEGSTDGVAMIDGAIVPGGEVLNPFRIELREGRIASIDNSQKDGRTLQALLESYNDQNMYCHVELGVGLNPKAKMGRGIELEDEGEFGTLHLGIGNGITFGSSIRAVGHVDLVIRHPIVEVDGTTVLKNWEVLV